MTNFTELLSTLKRPRLLISAARHGIEEYNRNRDLRRILSGPAPSPQEAIARLINTEEALEEARKGGGAGYSVARHVDVMIAILAEMRLINRQQPI
jgi:hypothetical protein